MKIQGKLKIIFNLSISFFKSTISILISFRNLLLEEFFTNNNQISLEGPLYLKSESKKGWKKYHFVLRASGLYYYPKEKSKSTKDLMCLAPFNAHNVYKGIGWKKKYKAPSDYGFALKCPKVNITGKGMKMLCAEDSETLEKWIMCCRIAKYGRKLIDNYKNIIDDLAREDLDKIASTRLSFTPISAQMSADKLSVGSQNGRLSRASTSSSSSGCLSDDNNAFESEFTTGTIKRKPTIKPNLPLTSKTRQLIKEVDDSTASRSDDTIDQNGTLTRRHTSHTSNNNNSGTLKRQNPNRCSYESMKSIPTPVTPDEVSFKPIIKSPDSIDSASKLITSSCMTDSMLSLPPPPPESTTECVMTASTLSLNSLPLPEPPDEDTLKQITRESLIEEPTHVDESQIVTEIINSINSCPMPQPPPQPTQQQQPIIYSTPATQKLPEIEPIYKTILKAPPYKSPPPVHNTKYSSPPPVPQKSVSFADSPPPVILRKKVCFDDQVEQITLSPRSERPPLPIRDRHTSLTSSNNSSPKRLCDSVCNPTQDFWKDLQRVVNKKLSVAQKCKMNAQMTPGEVLGFRDVSDPIYETNLNYKETSTTNWVIEHYGDNLYENWNGNNNNNINGNSSNRNSNSNSPNGTMQNPVIYRDMRQNLPLSPQRRSRGPPVPVRNSSTRLSTSTNGTSNSNEMQ